MTQSNKRALFTLVIWGFVLLAFVIIFFFIGNGPQNYVQDKPRFVVVAALFLAGYISYFTMIHLTRTRPDDMPLTTDERDESIARQANGIAFFSVLAYIYLLCIILHLTYEDSGYMPVSWMWFLGYSSIFVGYIIHAAATMTIGARMSAYG